MFFFIFISNFKETPSSSFRQKKAVERIRKIDKMIYSFKTIILKNKITLEGQKEKKKPLEFFFGFVQINL
jgi:hypothetical protein